MKEVKFIAAGLMLLLASCNDSKKETDKPLAESSAILTNDPVVYSFAFMGCNRVDRGDSSNASTANVLALQSIFNDITVLKNKPSVFFLLGDIVLGESDTKDLNSQLQAWLAQYKDTKFSSISTSGIEVVAVPGNHEMLDGSEKPLYGSADVWLKYMSPFMPSDRKQIANTASLDNRMTFSFVRNNTAFIVMNTDSYNPPTKQNPQGLEGIVPTDSILNWVNDFKANKAIEHIFVLGHKPYYVSGKSCTGHKGLPEGPVLWPAFNNAGVVAMLSAHEHDYQRWQLPADTGTYQIIAGNGGSQGEATFFGYTIINILKSGKVQLVSRGFTKQKHGKYYRLPYPVDFSTRDSTILTWSKNANPYPNYTSNKDCDLK
jgi:hypothetical protein